MYRQNEEDVYNTEEQIIKTLTEAAINIKDDGTKHNSWITEDILLLTEEERKQKKLLNFQKNSTK